MNENTPPTPPSPPMIPPQNLPAPPFPARAIAIPGGPPLGDEPSDRIPIRPHVFGVIDALLRHPRRLLFQLKEPGAKKLIVAMMVITALSSLAYGGIAGSFSGGAQIWMAAVKIAAGLAISGAICLPSLYILTCLSGSQARMIEVGGMLAGLLTLMTVLLIGFAPVAWIFSQSTSSLASMGALHIVFWLVATWFGARFMLAGFSHSHAKSQAGLNVWLAIFVLVALQMTTALRPIIGHSDTFLPKEKEFFIGHWSDCVDGSWRAPENAPAHN